MRIRVGASMISSSWLFRVRVNTEEGTQIAFVPLERFTIGSQPSLPVALNDPSVAKRHLVVSAVNGEIFLTDQQSSTGTRVNGRLLPANVPVRYVPGDKIVVGQVEYALQIHLFEQVVEGQACARAKTGLQELSSIKSNDKAELEAERILFEARNEAAELTRVAKQDAQEILHKAELQSLETLKAREEKIQEIVQTAHLQAEKIVQEARETSLKLQHEVSVRAAHERGVEASRILAEAGEEASRVKDEAYKAAQEGLRRLHQQAAERAEAIVKTHEQEANSILERARTLAQEIKVAAQEEANKYIKQALDQVHEIRTQASLEAETILADARRRALATVDGQELENARMLETARAYVTGFTEQAQKEAEQLKVEALKELESQKLEAKELLAQAEKFVRDRRAQVEAEIAKMREDEVQRIEENWNRMLAGFAKKPAELAAAPAPSRWGKILAFARPRRAG